ncbi:MAG: hypothetical protein M3228_14930 [Actinomycetota bacterium]|nr:hypothetical protein [Actinomycetota bacterium]
MNATHESFAEHLSGHDHRPRVLAGALSLGVLTPMRWRTLSRWIISAALALAAVVALIVLVIVHAGWVMGRTRRGQDRRSCLHSPGGSAKHGLALGIVECQLYQPKRQH